MIDERRTFSSWAESRIAILRSRSLDVEVVAAVAAAVARAAAADADCSVDSLATIAPCFWNLRRAGDRVLSPAEVRFSGRGVAASGSIAVRNPTSQRHKEESVCVREKVS